MQIEYNGIQFKDSLKLISSPLRSIVAQTLGGNLDLYVHTKQQLRKYCESDFVFGNVPADQVISIDAGTW